nr:glycosyl transferase family 2 [Mesorhizobium sp.]
MLTVLIETHNDEEGLARTLGSLVAGSVEGVVREVMVHDRGSTDHTTLVADHAGCSMIGEGDLTARLRHARGDWLLVLEPGSRLTEGWTEAVLLHMTSMTMPARFTRSRIGRPRFLARFFSTRRPFADGLLISKRQALGLLKGASDLAPVARVSTKRIAAEIIPSPKRA